MILNRLIRMDTDATNVGVARDALAYALESIANEVPPGQAITNLEISQVFTIDYIQVIIVARTA